MRFNAISYSNKMCAAGLEKKIADVVAEELSEVINNDLATKSDLFGVKNDLKHEIQAIKNEIIVKVGGMMIAGFGILGFILKR